MFEFLPDRYSKLAPVHMAVVAIFLLLGIIGVIDTTFFKILVIWTSINLLVIPYVRRFRTPEIQIPRCLKCGSLMHTERLKCENCGATFDLS